MKLAIQTSFWLLAASSCRAAFKIEFNISGASDSQIQTVQQAADRWAQVVTGDLPVTRLGVMNRALVSIGLDCKGSPRKIDDIYVCGQFKTIDGPGQNGYNILGGASIVYSRDDDKFIPNYGYMQFDSYDIARLESSGKLYAVILHEMGHLLGIGINWRKVGLTGSVTSGCPYGVDTSASREWQAVSGCMGGAVPTETDYPNQTGTQCSHWSERCLQNELMTGFANSGKAILSKITVGSLEDLGYQVNYSAADAYISSDVGHSCRCNSSVTLRSNGTRGLRWRILDTPTSASSTIHTNPMASSNKQNHRRLSLIAHRAAWQYGKNLLTKYRSLRDQFDSQSGQIYLADQFVSVIVSEGGSIYSMEVWADEQ